MKRETSPTFHAPVGAAADTDGVSIKVTKILAGAIVTLAATAADPEARYALRPLGQDDRPTTAQLSSAR